MPPDWWELLETLQRHRVRYLLIGGHAVSVHGTPRTTEDMDLTVAQTRANGVRLRAALIEFGLGSFAPQAAEILEPDMFWRFPGLDVPVLGLDDLLANKRAAGRPKDLADVDALEAARARRSPMPPRRAGRRRTA